MISKGRKKSIHDITFLDSSILLVYKARIKEETMEKIKTVDIQIVAVIIGILIIIPSTYGGWVMV